jgi:hypothetical protein
MTYERRLVEQADIELPSKLSEGESGMAIVRLSAEELAAFRKAALGLGGYFEGTAGRELLGKFKASAAAAERVP